jgi:hypothetical protein
MEPPAASHGAPAEQAPTRSSAPILPPLSPPQPSWKQEFKHEPAPSDAPPAAAAPESVEPVPSAEPAPEAPEKKEE